jgi:excisionase family DNA binding protein
MERRGTQFEMTLFTPREAAEQLKCSVNHVYRLIARAELRTVDIAPVGSQRPKTRIRRGDLAAYIDSRTPRPSIKDPPLGCCTATR